MIKPSAFLDRATDAFAFGTLIISFLIVYCVVCPPEPARHFERPITFAKITSRAQ